MNESISIDEARKLVLLSQRVLPSRPSGSAISATRAAIEHLGYIQIDTISVIQRAHHHTLWNRNPRYQASHLAQLLDDKHVFEYWSHAAAYLPMRDFRFSLPRKHSLRLGDLTHWYKPSPAMIKQVLRRITTEGPLMARDFVDKETKVGAWKAKPTKRALEYLFMQGELMVPCRVNFQKVYDLTERVLPSGTDTKLPGSEEYARYLITRYLRANGLGQPAEMSYLLKGIKPIVATTLKEMVSSGELLEVQVNEERYYATPLSLERLGKPLTRRRLRILSPFDNLVIQRKRMKSLFEFDYLIECYVPESKRKYGYFCLPILWNGQLVARMDCRTDRNESTLHIQQFIVESSLMKTKEMLQALRKELIEFLRFNDCTNIQLHKTKPGKLKRELKSTLNDLITACG